MFCVCVFFWLMFFSWLFFCVCVCVLRLWLLIKTWRVRPYAYTVCWFNVNVKLWHEKIHRIFIIQLWILPVPRFTTNNKIWNTHFGGPSGTVHVLNKHKILNKQTQRILFSQSHDLPLFLSPANADFCFPSLARITSTPNRSKQIVVAIFTDFASQALFKGANKYASIRIRIMECNNERTIENYIILTVNIFVMRSNNSKEREK